MYLHNVGKLHLFSLNKMKFSLFIYNFCRYIFLHTFHSFLLVFIGSYMSNNTCNAAAYLLKKAILEIVPVQLFYWIFSYRRLLHHTTVDKLCFHLVLQVHGHLQAMQVKMQTNLLLLQVLLYI